MRAQGKEITRVTDELGAIVTGTETATNSILAAAERIDELSSNPHPDWLEAIRISPVRSSIT